MNEIVAQLRQYIGAEVLEGEDVGLEPATPLLELGILNSMEVLRLIGFIEKTFGVSVALEQITAEHFRSIEAIAALVNRLRAKRTTDHDRS